MQQREKRKKNRTGTQQMLHGMAAYSDCAIDGRVEALSKLGEEIHQERPPHPRGTLAAARVKPQHQCDQEKRQELHQRIRPQIADAMPLLERAKQNPHFFGALSATAQGKFLPQTGAVVIKDKDGNVLGAAGASGGTGDEDEAVCIAGVEAAGLVAG